MNNVIIVISDGKVTEVYSDEPVDYRVITLDPPDYDLYGFSSDPTGYLDSEEFCQNRLGLEPDIDQDEEDGDGD